MSTSLKLMFIFWQLGLVDTFSVIQLCVNSGSQYLAIVVASAGGNLSDIGPKVLFEPIFGLGTSCQFIRAAQTAAERIASFQKTFHSIYRNRNISFISTSIIN